MTGWFLQCHQTQNLYCVVSFAHDRMVSTVSPNTELVLSREFRLHRMVSTVPHPLLPALLLCSGHIVELPNIRRSSARRSDY